MRSTSRAEIHACRGTRRPLAASVAAYALCPIDLIPDFVPVLGYLDEVIVLPLGIMLAIRMIPDEVMAEHRASALRAEGRPVSRAGAAAIIAVWITAALLGSWLTWRYFSD